MNAVNSLARELEAAKLGHANRWPDDIKPLIQAYLDTGALLDRLEMGFNGWKPNGPAEEKMAQVHSALADDHGRLHRDIEDWRYDWIEQAIPRPYSRNMTQAEHDAYDASHEYLMSGATSVDAAVKAVEAGL